MLFLVRKMSLVECQREDWRCRRKMRKMKNMRRKMRKKNDEEEKMKMKKKLR